MSQLLKHQISSSEWILLTLFLIFGVSLIGIAKFNVQRVKESVQEISLDPTECLVTVAGAVKHPGVYSVLEGTALGVVLRKAGVRLDSDLRAMDPQMIVMGPLHLQIEALQEIRIQVEGEVLQPLEVVLPVGSRICDLRSKISCSKEADLRFFRRKRTLRDGEKIWVPKKTVE